MAQGPVDRNDPEGEFNPANALARIAGTFKNYQEKIRKCALEGEGKAKSYAADGTQIGGPKKHVIAAAFACCDDEISKLFGRVRWRCSMSITKKTKISKVKTILDAVREEAQQTHDDYPKIFEYMHDFSASNYALTEVIGKKQGFNWPAGGQHNQFHRLWVAVESETGGKYPDERRFLVTRDLIKLCVVDSAIRVLVYKGYEAIQPKTIMLNAIRDTIRHCYPAGNIPGRWLFIGLLGTWPESQSIYCHTLNEAGTATPEQVVQDMPV